MKKRNKTTHIIIHCSATIDDVDIGVKEIKEWHLEKGWSDIGYHYVIRRNGNIEIGRNIHLQGAHCKGYNNKSIGICLVGGYDGVDNFMHVQFQTLADLVLVLQSFYEDTLEVIGHKDTGAKKECPSFDVEEFLIISKEKGYI